MDEEEYREAFIIEFKHLTFCDEEYAEMALKDWEQSGMIDNYTDPKEDALECLSASCQSMC